MSNSNSRVAWTSMVLIVVACSLGVYFIFAAVQGDYGVLRRVEVNAETDVLRAEKQVLESELASLQNLTHRLSDDFLDIDLLDQQVRDVLGYIRADEVVLR